MKKKAFFPLIIFAILALRQVLDMPNVIRMFSMPILSPLGVVGICTSLILILFPIVTTVMLLWAGSEKTSEHTRGHIKRIMSIICFAAAGSMFYGVLTNVIAFGKMGYALDFYSLVMYSPLLQMIINIFTGILLIMCGCYILKSIHRIPGVYIAVFIVGITLLVFFSLLVVIGGKNSILIYAWSFLRMVGIWLLPMVFIDAENEASAKKLSRNIIIIVVILLIVAWAMAGGTGGSNTYDDVFDKDPNEWTEDEEQYVNDLFEWIDENQED